eukprot:COSAG05_NODE_207_length_14113_cov_13.452119_9_plen_104_part_00
MILPSAGIEFLPREDALISKGHPSPLRKRISRPRTQPMTARGPRRFGRNQAAQAEEVEDAASDDSFHSDVSEAAAGRDQEGEGGEEAGGGQPATEQPAAGGDL